MHCKDKTMHYLLLVHFHLSGRNSFAMPVELHAEGFFFIIVGDIRLRPAQFDHSDWLQPEVCGFFFFFLPTLI